MPKSGTSHLYRVISSHPYAAPLKDDEKEYCQRGQPQWYATDVEERVKERVIKGDKGRGHVVNGCHNVTEVIMQYKERAISTGTKFITLLRSPASLCYSSYHFWSLPDENSHIWDWSSRNYTRSPEHFDEVIRALKSKEDFCGFLHQPCYGHDDGEGNFVFSAAYTRELIEAFGRDNIMFYKMEDLSDVEKLVSSLEAFTGLYRSGFSTTILNEVTNTGDNRGPTIATNASDHKGKTGYDHSGYKDMLEDTRRYINDKWRETCKHWREDLHVDYDDC